MDVLLTNNPNGGVVVPIARPETEGPRAPTNSIASGTAVSVLDAAAAAATEVSDPLAGALGVQGTQKENLVFLGAVLFILWKWF